MARRRDLRRPLRANELTYCLQATGKASGSVQRPITASASTTAIQPDRADQLPIGAPDVPFQSSRGSERYRSYWVIGRFYR